MPAQLVLDTQVTFVTDPMHPIVNDYFTASFQEINVGDEPTGDYQHTFSMNDMSGTYDFTIDCGSLEPGESALRTATECWVPNSGSFNMNVTVHGFLGNVIVEDAPA
jgi:hypothetical protein